jgi:hypothetical protein
MIAIYYYQWLKQDKSEIQKLTWQPIVLSFVLPVRSPVPPVQSPVSSVPSAVQSAAASTTIAAVSAAVDLGLPAYS